MSNPKTDCEAVMNTLLPFAVQMLNNHGGFNPYGGVMHADGEIRMVGADNGQEYPQSSELIKLLKGAFAAGAEGGEYKATALVYDVRTIVPTGEKSDAIAVSLDHRDDYSVIVFFPYKIEDGAAIIGAAFAQKGAADIFPAR